MCRLILIAFAASLTLHLASTRTVHHDPNLKIIDGSEVNPPHSAPYMALVKINRLNSETEELEETDCGGTLISNNYVLTAAQCLPESTREIKIILGLHDKSKQADENAVEVSGDYYVLADPGNDLAIIKLQSSVEYNDNIQAVALPKRSDADNDFADVNGKAYGWGQTGNDEPASSVLKEAELQIISERSCDQLGVYPGEHYTCAGTAADKGICLGDSGGPLIANGIQIGITSRSGGLKCAQGLPDMFTRVAKFLDFIQENSDVKFD